MLAPTLRDSLLDGENLNIFDTQEVAVYDGERLVAFSFFDLGKNSVASIMGIYDPAYSKYSLGFFTMLMEIAFAQENDFEFYYPGYVVPGYERFDYKLRIGEVQYYDLAASAWLSHGKLRDADIPVNQMNRKLKELNLLLEKQGLGSRKMYYPLFEVNLFGFWRTNFFDHPVFLHCNFRKSKHVQLMVVYDVRSRSYLLMRCSPFDDIQFYFNESYTNSFDRETFFMELVVIDEVIAQEAKPEIIARHIRNYYNLPNPG